MSEETKEVENTENTNEKTVTKVEYRLNKKSILQSIALAAVVGGISGVATTAALGGFTPAPVVEVTKWWKFW